MEYVSSILGIDSLPELIVIVAMICFIGFSSFFLISVIAYQIFEDFRVRRKRAIKEQFVMKNSINLSPPLKNRISALSKPRLRVVDLGAPPTTLFENTSNLANSTDSQPLVASIDFLEKDQYAFILLCCWGKQ